MTCERHGGGTGSIICRECDLEIIEREAAMTNKLKMPKYPFINAHPLDANGNSHQTVAKSEYDLLRAFCDQQAAELQRAKDIGCELQINLGKSEHQVKEQASEIERLRAEVADLKLQVDVARKMYGRENELAESAEARVKVLEAALKRCRPAVKTYLNTKEQSILKIGTTFPEYYRPVLEADANEHRALLDQIEALKVTK